MLLRRFYRHGRILSAEIGGAICRRMSVGIGGSTCSLSASSQLTRVQDADNARYITMTSSRNRNALSLDMILELQEHVGSVGDSVRCIVLAAEGPAFSAGHNLKELTSEQGREHHQRVFQACSKLMLSLQSADVPVIAQVDGVAAAAGLQLVASCDIVLATPRSQFSTPGADVGIFCSTPGVALVRVVPRLVAARMLLTGQSISGQQALWAGLVSELVEPDWLAERTRDTVRAVASKSRSVQTLGKRFLYRQLQQGVQDAYQDGAAVMVDNLTLQDAQEGISAFIQKRNPSWTHSDRKAHD